MTIVYVLAGSSGERRNDIDSFLERSIRNPEAAEQW